MRLVTEDLSTMAGRIRYLLALHEVSAREFARRAKLAGGHVNTFLDRAREAPDTTLSSKTAQQIASAWGVDYTWLTTGEGASPGAQPELAAAPEDSTGPGRWRQYARRYWAFRAEATIALANGCPEAALDAASDALGARHGDGPTEEQARAAIEGYRERIRPVRLDGTDASEADFQPPPRRARGKR